MIEVQRAGQALHVAGPRAQGAQRCRRWTASAGAPPTVRITGLLGPNGAGKTTTLRMVAGLIAPDAGRVQVDGIDVAREPRAALARMGVLSDARGLYPRLTARENIVYYGRLQGMRGRRRRRARRRTGPDAGHAAAARPPHRRLQPGRAHEDGAGARPGARPGEHHARRADQRPGRAGHARAARGAAPAARRTRQVHRLFDPHHAGGGPTCATAWCSSRMGARWPKARWPNSTRAPGRPISRRPSCSWPSAPTKRERTGGAA